MNDNGDDELCQLSHNDEDDGKEVALPAVQLLSIRHTPVLPIQSPPAVSDPKVLKYFVKRYSRTLYSSNLLAVLSEIPVRSR